MDMRGTYLFYWELYSGYPRPLCRATPAWQGGGGSNERGGVSYDLVAKFFSSNALVWPLEFSILAAGLYPPSDALREPFYNWTLAQESQKYNFCHYFQF